MRPAHAFGRQPLPSQPPGLQIYGTIGGGLYVQILNSRSNEGNDAWNIGGGIKIAHGERLNGPVCRVVMTLAPFDC